MSRRPRRFTTIQAGGPGDDPTVLGHIFPPSPWRFYDQEMRIIPVEELGGFGTPPSQKGCSTLSQGLLERCGARAERKSPAARIFQCFGRKSRSKARMVSSGWRGTVPANDKTGASVMSGSALSGQKGGEVLAALVASWLTFPEDPASGRRDAEGLLHAGAGADIFLLCPTRPCVSSLTRRQVWGSPIAAYNGGADASGPGRTGRPLGCSAPSEQAAQAEDRPARELLNRLAWLISLPLDSSLTCRVGGRPPLPASVHSRAGVSSPQPYQSHLAAAWLVPRGFRHDDPMAAG